MAKEAGGSLDVLVRIAEIAHAVRCGGFRHQLHQPDGALVRDVSGKVLILVYVVGVGHRWFVYEGPTTWAPPVATPK
jgi:hypothetical protein